MTALDRNNDTEHTVVSTREGYDRWSQIYDEEDNPLITLEARVFPALIGDVCGLNVVDIGCGTGRHALPLTTAGARVTAVDFSEGMMARARAKPGAAAIRFVRHDLRYPLPFKSRTFDRVLCCLVLDHIADPACLLGEMARVCKPAGCVLISVMHPAMLLLGIQAQFNDPFTGRKIRPASIKNQMSDYIMAAAQAPLVFDHMSEHAVDHDLAVRSPRAAKYEGWPILLLLRLRPDEKT